MAAQLLFLCPAHFIIQPRRATTLVWHALAFSRTDYRIPAIHLLFSQIYTVPARCHNHPLVHTPRACQHEGRRAAGTVGVKSPLIGTWWQGERASSILIQLRNNASEQIKVVSARLKTAHRGLFQSVLVVNVL